MDEARGEDLATAVSVRAVGVSPPLAQARAGPGPDASDPTPTTRPPDAVLRPPNPAADAEPAPGAEARTRRAGVFGSTRFRMVAAYLILLVVALAVAILGIRQVLLVRVDHRVQEALNQEVLEIRTLIANGSDPATGEPFASLERAFNIFMDRNVPSVEEAFVTFLDGELHRDRLRSFPGRAIPDGALASWAQFSVEEGPEEITGTFEAAAGEADFRATRFTLGDEQGAFVVTILPVAERRGIQELQTYGAGVMVAIVLAAAVCAWFLAGRVLAPVRELTETARSISDADRTARIRVAGAGEAAEMAATFNDMLDRLDVAYQSQIDFVRAAGHELRTPLTVAAGHLELLGDDEDERRDVVPLVLDELSRMGRMVDDLQSLVEAIGPDFLQPEVLDAELLAYELVAKATALGDRTWRLDHASAGTFVADKHRLTEAVLNLADNAVKHTDPGGEIGIGVELSADYVRVWVRDAGCGVVADEAERIFDRFTRGHGAMKRYRGAGLGLAIVESIAEAHGGRVTLSSEPGQGARFTIEMPAGVVMARILIAEDDPLISSFLEKGLRANGYTTYVADDGALAAQMSLTDGFDLLILDLALPGREGFHVLQELRQRGRHVPVLVLTGRPELRDAVACLDVGADDYMTKPFRFEELLARVRARLRVPGTEESTVIEAGSIVLDTRTRRAKVDERQIDLTAREYGLLEVFMRHPDQVLTRDQLLSHVWGYNAEPGTNVVNVYVGALRKKLGDDVIESVRGVGYRFRVR